MKGLMLREAFLAGSVETKLEKVVDVRGVPRAADRPPIEALLK